MFERALFAIALLIIGSLGYVSYRRNLLRRIKQQIDHDPILIGLKNGVPTIVYFTTPTCVPCRTQQQPALVQLQDELGENVQIVKIDATEDPNTADRWGVFSAPTTFILDSNGVPRQVNHGVADSNRLKQQIFSVA